MPAKSGSLKRSPIPISSLLGLDQAKPVSNGRDRFFFNSPIIKQRLSMLKNMVGGRSMLIVVIGERGSGKTSLMNEFVFTSGCKWQACRFKLSSGKKRGQNRCDNLNSRVVLRSEETKLPSIIIDDAHELTLRDLKKLLSSSFGSKRPRKFRTIVMFAEPDMRERFAEIARWLPPKSVIDKIFMTPFTEKQTADYLQHRLKAAGIIRKTPFTEEQVRRIYRQSGGLPGWINGAAFLELKKMGKHQRGFKRSILAKWMSTLRCHSAWLADISLIGKKLGFHLK